MYLVIDIGNTLHKAAIFSETGELVDLHKYCKLTPTRTNRLFAKQKISHAILSSVGKYNADIEAVIQQHCPLIILSDTTPLPIKIKYKTPGSLGSDRVANAVGASSKFPAHNVLSIQLGSCMVCDFVNAKGEYLGGSITPGINMRFKALKHYTRKLPEVRKRMPEQWLGDDTESSIRCGVMNGIVGEINSIIAEYSRQNPTLKVLLTGGDAELLQNSIKFPIFATPNIVLWGLYEILRFNVEK